MMSKITDPMTTKLCVDAATAEEAYRKLERYVTNPGDWHAEYTEDGPRGSVRFWFTTR